MFLRQDNSIKWKKLAIASVVVVFLCLAGVMWFDKPLFLFLRNFNWSVWGFFDTVFTTEIWLAAAFCVALVIVIKNVVKSKHKVTKDKNKFSIKKIINKFKEKSKNNFGFLVLCSVFLAGLITDILKYGFGRQRPIFFEALGQSGFYPMNNDWAFNSMPSGHATASFAGLIMIGLLFPKIKWATWTLAIVIGVSRICCGDHWPSDVIFSAFIGMVVADIVKSVFFKNK
ncbi:MAG TPA: phosphatase PAP2 family protein [Alphaproteobacteria bacterium]|nr:phosphatase PAP2 family protein [Alphaproteobacteria bacterium]